ncbi:MAG: transcriptional regulator [Gammaproteobacteria bacterium]|nr:transcriptional regulator [Gammaproteobacteria bacterium]
MLDKNTSSCDKILYLLKTGGPETAAVLAKSLNITSMGARQHLQNLTDEGLIEFQDIKQGRGRPARYWKTTKAADEKFPNAHSELTLQLINAAEEVFGEGGVSKLINARQKKSLLRYQKHIKGSSDLETILNRLAEIRTKEGYMANVEAIGGAFLLNENHCPISTVASNCGGLCDSELVLFRQILGEQYVVARAEHILSGAGRCSYHISLKENQYEILVK